jgi:hypothetical protein
MSDLRYLEVNGSPRAMGEAHGETYRDEIRDFSARRMAHLISFIARYDPGRDLAAPGVLSVASELLEAHRHYDGPLWQEFAGIARGAGVPEEELLVGNGLTDVRDLVLMRGLGRRGTAGPGSRDSDGSSPRAVGDTGECTVFGASAEACGGTPIIGQTWDMHPDARDFLLVIRRMPEDRPATMTLTTVGCLPLTGVNSDGVGICTSNLTPIDARTGICYLFTIANALGSSSAEAAAAAITDTPRLSGHCFMVADGSDVIDVETTACHARKTIQESGVRVHSNHYLDAELSELAFGGVDTASSRWRRQHLDGALRDADRPIDEALCWELLSDATRGDGAVCNEDYEGRFGDVATAATVVITPDAGRVTACAGSGRRGKKRLFSL